jgi:hypothetical protein
MPAVMASLFPVSASFWHAGGTRVSLDDQYQSECLIPVANLLGAGIQLGAVTLTPVRINAEPIIRRARKHMQVDMKYLLEGSFTISKEHVYAFTRQARPVQGPGQAMCHLEQMGALILGENFQGLCMSAREHE